MNEEKRNYLIISNGFNFCINGFKEDAIKIAKKIKKNRNRKLSKF